MKKLLFIAVICIPYFALSQNKKENKSIKYHSNEATLESSPGQMHKRDSLRMHRLVVSQVDTVNNPPKKKIVHKRKKH